jgi:hypothetical protein
MERTQILNGPIAPGWGGTIIYSVTLGNGFIVTSPSGFGSDSPPPAPAFGVTVVERDYLTSREYFGALRDRISARHAE